MPITTSSQVLLPGTIVNSWAGTYATNANLTTQIPTDDSIPQQSTEGTQIISVSVGALKASTNKLRLLFSGWATTSATTTITTALFKDAGEDAIFAQGITQNDVAVYQTNLGFVVEYTPGAATAAAYKINVGPNSSATVRLNGSTSARRYGGVAVATLIIEEVVV